MAYARQHFMFLMEGTGDVEDIALGDRVGHQSEGTTAGTCQAICRVNCETVRANRVL
jgi:hypothetical protein